MSAPAPQRRLALFDIDGTLLPGRSSERRFFWELLRQRRLGAAQLWRHGSFVLTQWPRYGHHVTKKNKAYLLGLDAEELAELARAYARGPLLRSLFPPVVRRVRYHLQQGDEVLLLSGTLQPLAAGLAEALGVHGALGTDCTVRGGRYADAHPRRHPFAQEKLALASRLCAARGLPLTALAAYGDSIHDLPLLAASGRAVAVQPDKRLRQIAEARGWEIIAATPASKALPRRPGTA